MVFYFYIMKKETLLFGIYPVIEALKTKDSIEKIIEITSSEENPKTNMSKAIKAFSI